MYLEPYQKFMMNFLLQKYLIAQSPLLCLQKNFIMDVPFYTSEVVVRKYSVKKLLLKISQNSQENTCVRVSFLTKFQASACNLIKKETLTEVFSCEICESFKNAFFIKHLKWMLLILQDTKLNWKLNCRGRFRTLSN